MAEKENGAERVLDPETGEQIGYGNVDFFRLTMMEGRMVDVEMRDNGNLWLLKSCCWAVDPASKWKDDRENDDPVVAVEETFRFSERIVPGFKNKVG